MDSVVRRLHVSRWVIPAAAAWSLAYGVAAVSWAAGGAGFPFGAEGDPEAGLSLLGGVTREAAAPVIAVLALGAGAIATLMHAGHGRGATRTALLAFGAVVALVLTVLVPDYRVLVVLAYAPVFLAGAPFGWPPGVSLLAELTWPLINQVIVLAGGIAWAGATIVYARRTRGACPRCGRPVEADDAADRHRAATWGRRAVVVAVLIPGFYAATRYAWALGIPLGVSDAFLAEGATNGMWLAGAALATVALVGAGLTIGLVRPWGERFPGWLPIAGGHSVPVALAVVPALLVAVVVTSAGVMFVRLIAFGTSPFGPGDWGALAPEVLWPIWGAALGTAALSYHYRRRGPCPACRRGSAEPRAARPAQSPSGPAAHMLNEVSP